MIDVSSKFLISLVSILSKASIASSALYEFILANDEVFDNCPQIPGNRGIHDLFDMSNVTLVYSEGRVTIGGSGVCNWEGVQPNDRIRSRAELLKYHRGTWQPTPLSSATNNFCETLFDPTSLTYHMWGRHIVESERKCLSNYGHTYHYRPFMVDTVLEFPWNIEGRHKLV